MTSVTVCPASSCQTSSSIRPSSRVGYSRLARLYVRLRSGQFIRLLLDRRPVLRKSKYPAHDAFVANVKLEAEQNVRRLRHHPSIVILAGNNEGRAPSQSPKSGGTSSNTRDADYQLAESSELDLDYEDEESDFRKTNFPGRHIYERVLPQIVKEYSDFHYHRGSPYSGHGKVTTDQTYGDLHQWNVWHGSQEPWHKWDVLAGRFVSEFGMSVAQDFQRCWH